MAHWKTLAWTALAVFWLEPGRLHAEGKPPAESRLVVKRSDGSFAPGVFTSWVVNGDTLVLSLSPEANQADVLSLVKSRLAHAVITALQGKIAIQRVAATAVLEHLSNLDLGDPLVALGALGNAVASADHPEGGGSIRASQQAGDPAWGKRAPPAPGRAQTRVIARHDPKERLNARVLGVTCDAFPWVRIRVKLLTAARTGELADKLKKGAEINAPVAFASTLAGIDFFDAHNRLNLGANYLVPGDLVQIHVIMTNRVLEIDYVERVRGGAS